MPKLVECNVCGIFHAENESCLTAMRRQRDWYRDLCNGTRQTLIDRDTIYLNQREAQERDRDVARRLLRENVKPLSPRWNAYCRWYPWLREHSQDQPDPEQQMSAYAGSGASAES